MKKEELDRIVLGYLRKKGYQSAAKAFCDDSGRHISCEAAPWPHLPGGQFLQDPGVCLKPLTYAVAGVNTCAEQQAAMSIKPGDPTLYNEAYDKLVSWVLGSLDIYRYELSGILYPLFLHVFLILHEKGSSFAAQQLFSKHKRTIIETSPLRMQKQRMEELQDLQGVTSSQHILTNRTAQAAKSIRYPVSLLNQFLATNDVTILILYVVNERLQLDVRSRPPITAADFEDGDEEGFGLLSMGEAGVVGGEVLATNSQPVKLGLLKEDPEAKFAEAERVKFEKETEKEEQDKDKPKRKKTLKADEGDEAGAATKTAKGAVPYSIVETELPIAALDEDEEALVMKDIRHRAPLSTEALPSCLMFTFVNTHQSLNCAAPSSDGTMVAAGFEDSSIRIFDVEAMAERRMGSTRKEAQPGKGSAGKRGQPDDKGNSIEDMEWDGLSGQHGTDKQPEEGKDSNSSKSMNTLRRRMPCDRAELISLSGHSGAVYSLSWSCNQRYLLSSSADCSIRLWSLELGSNLVSYRGHSHPVWAVQASPQGQYFASASADKTARVWSTEHRQALRMLVGHQSDVDTLCWLPSSNYIATGSSDTTVRLWHVASGRCARILVGHRSAVCSIASSPCGRTLATGSIDGAICIWDLNEGKRLSQLKGHEGPVWSLGYSCGLQRAPLLASGGADCTVRLWGTTPPVQTTPLADTPVQAEDAAYSLLQTFPTKSTPAFDVTFSRGNMLMASGALTLQSSRGTGAAKSR